MKNPYKIILSVIIAIINYLLISNFFLVKIELDKMVYLVVCMETFAVLFLAYFTIELFTSGYQNDRVDLF